MEYIIMVIIVAATIAFVALPIVRRDETGEEPIVVDFTLAELKEEKESAYNALKEAEFDYETGKLSDKDYQAIKDKYTARAVESLHKLEEYEKQRSEVRGERSESELDEEKADVGRVRRTRQSELDEEKAVKGQKTTANFCSSCGTKITKDTKFCGGCGQRLN